MAKAEFNMADVMRRTEIKFDVKVRGLSGFSMRAWLFVRLVNLAGWILGSKVTVGMEKTE